MTRMLMLSGAMVLALATSGTARAATQILDCYGANGQVVACAADYGAAKTTPAEEQIVVVGIRPDWDASSAESHPATRSSRPGLGGDWTPVVATNPTDQLQQWQTTFLSGEGLSAALHF